MKSTLLACALAAASTLGARAADLRVVEVDWDDFRHYIAAHAWIADMDFREGEVQGLHVCAGFNAFNHYSRDPSQMSRYGFEGALHPNEKLQAAAFTITMNSRPVMDQAFSFAQELRQSEEYKGKTGDERLAYSRDAMWRHVSSDPVVKSAVRETVRELHDATVKLVEAGLLSAGALPDEPFKYMLGMNNIMSYPKAVESILVDARFRALSGVEARRAFFVGEFSAAVAESAGIEDPQQRSSFRDSIRHDLDPLFGSGGSYVLRFSR